MNIIKTEFLTNSDHRGNNKLIAQNVDVLRITSKNGSKHGAHYHLTGSHLCVVISGSLIYYERPVNSNIKPTKL